MIIFEIAFPIITIFTLFASIRISLEGFVKFPQNVLLKYMTADKWCLSLIIFLPMLLGQFARGEASPIPWEEFMDSYYRHGFFDGLISAIIVIVVDLWLFWTTANYWIIRHEDIDKTHRRMARIINLLIGIILSSTANPIYGFLDIDFSLIR